MTELKPIEQYEVVPNMDALTKAAAPDGDGQQPAAPTIDQQSKQAAMAKAMLENMKRQKEAACGEEINRAITEICKRHHCQVRFMELRQDGEPVKIWVQPVLVDESAT